MVRCEGNRYIGAGVQAPDFAGDVQPAGEWLVITRIVPVRESSRSLLFEFTRDCGPFGPYYCANHTEGHTLDGGLLREEIRRLSLPGKPGRRGKVPSIDIKTVELGGRDMLHNQHRP
jgi:hypothetical protein